MTWKIAEYCVYDDVKCNTLTISVSYNAERNSCLSFTRRKRGEKKKPIYCAMSKHFSIDTKVI